MQVKVRGTYCPHKANEVWFDSITCKIAKSQKTDDMGLGLERNTKLTPKERF
jgi:hypothetical protein